MTVIDTACEGPVEQLPIRFVTEDGFALTGTWFVPTDSSAKISTAVVVTGGAGIPGVYYSRFAQYMAERGAAVLTYDYRGIGASREGSIRELRAGMDHWAGLDFAAALALARTRYPDISLSVVAHSVGTVFVGAAPDSAHISKIVFFGAHTGYWRDYAAKWRWALFLVWHVFMPVVTKLFGYFPGRMLRLGGDLPRQAALDWAARRQPQIVKNPEDQLRFGKLLSRCAATRANVLVLSISDDAFAPPAAAARVLSLYPNVVSVHETVTPESLGFRRLGHLGFLRKASGEFFWRRTSNWLLPPESTSKPPG